MPPLPSPSDLQVYGYLTGVGILPVNEVANWRRASSTSGDAGTFTLGNIPSTAKGAFATVTSFASNSANKCVSPAHHLDNSFARDL